MSVKRKRNRKSVADVVEERIEDSVASLSAVRSSQDVTDGRIMRAGDNARGAALS